MRGIFVVIEGIDGCGKGTQLAMLDGYLRLLGRKTVRFYDPGSAPVAVGLRRLLLNKELPMDSLTQLLLFTAARRATTQLVRDTLASGSDVLCDRWVLSTLMYQSKLGDVTPQLVTDLHSQFCGNLHPDVCLVLDVSADTARARKTRDVKDRFESNDLAWHAKLRNAYRAQCQVSDLPVKPVLVDGNGSVEDVHRRLVGACLEASHAFAKLVAAGQLIKEKPDAHADVHSADAPVPVGTT